MAVRDTGADLVAVRYDGEQEVVVSLNEVLEKIEELGAEERGALIKILSIGAEPIDVELEDWEEKLIEESWARFEASGRKGRPWSKVKAEILKRLK